MLPKLCGVNPVVPRGCGGDSAPRFPHIWPMQAPLFDTTYARLPERFWERPPLQPVKAPRLLLLNRPLAAELGLDPDWLESDAGVAMLAGNEMPESAAGIALAYAGHQFGHFNPQLGDGRACSSSANSSTARAAAATSSSRAPAARASRAAATGARRWVLRCANT